MLNPVPLTLAELNTEHPEYTRLAPVWRTISALRDGFPAIKRNVQRFIPKRPAEEDDLYALRVAKLAYNPIMSNVVSTYTGKLARGRVDFPDSIDNFWKELRKNNQRKGKARRSESQLLSELFGEMLYYGRVYVQVAVPNAAEQLRTAYELRSSGLTPYFQVLDPLEVINWGEDWLVLRQYIQTSKPFGGVETVAQFTYLGLNEVVTYRIPCQLRDAADADGNLYPTVYKVKKGNEYIVPNKEDKFSPEPVVKGDGLGYGRIVKTCIPEEKWLCLALYNKQIQHLRIENSWTDAGYLSGVVQRVFTPADPVATDDPRLVVDTESYEKELAKVGNEHILVGKGYQFVESSGTAVGNLSAMLDKIEAQIKQIANLHFATGDTSVLNQSGLSKQMDLSLLDGVLAEYGDILIDVYNGLLTITARLLSLASVEVAGLSDFAEKRPLDTLSIIQSVVNLPDFPIQAIYFLYMKLIEDAGIEISPNDIVLVDTQPVDSNTDG